MKTMTWYRPDDLRVVRNRATQAERIDSRNSVPKASMKKQKIRLCVMVERTMMMARVRMRSMSGNLFET